MLKLTIDKIELEVPDGYTVLQACELLNKEIPRFCYHDRLSIAGNCRMCLVQVGNNTVKPFASCALPVVNNMEIFTDTHMVRKAREGILEFLLINHPLDCPICDQGGECDLQDITMRYGAVKSRFFDNKRSVSNKYMGPLIKTFMNRCIHCTRCVRFMSEVAGVDSIGVIHRGEDSEITTLEKAISSELSANIIDLCPVGALTSKPYAFHARPWELSKTETIDVMDALGSNIRVDSKGNSVMRILPVLNENINEEWISDKTRYACDGLRIQRLDSPYIKRDGTLQPVSWDEALSYACQKLSSFQPNEIAAIVGDLVDVESIYSFKKLLEILNVKNLECRQDGSYFDPRNRESYLFNATVSGIDESDALLIIGANPRIESPVLNARIRKRWLNTKLPIALVGEKEDFTYPYEHLSSSPLYLNDIARSSFAEILRNSNKPIVLIGTHVATRSDFFAIQNIVQSLGIIRDDWNGYCQLHTAASRVGALDLGFAPSNHKINIVHMLSSKKSNSIKCVYLLGADEFDMSFVQDRFVIYQGHHGDRGANVADIIFPSAAYTEKDATFVNLEGRVQRAHAAVSPPGAAQEDWKIFRALSDCLGKSLSFNTFEQLRTLLYEEHPHFSNIGHIQRGQWKEIISSDNIQDSRLFSSISCFYQTCSISRASPTMSRCVSELINKSQEAA